MSPTAAWTRKEKFALLNALYKYGPNDIESLSKKVPNKTLEALTRRLNLYKRIARKETVYKDQAVDKAHFSYGRNKIWPNSSSITRWRCLISKSCAPSALKTRLSEAIRLIAHLEDHPPPGRFLKIDLKSIYLHLASLMEGTTPQDLNPESREYLINEMIELSKTGKSNSFSNEINFVHNVSRIFPNRESPSIKVNTPTSSALVDIIGSIAYNPLDVPEHLLSMDQNDTEEKPIVN